ncbi:MULTISPECIES: DUF445 domain-containing protein [unclassified Sporosarcina]|uniref:DUF445 domain-containing protein n=1 Tax=unclassified Sporosarcina TaxID=2647733 RepID=UPI002040FB89|nr:MULTISPECIES: DUF445 family protein [unclassified Sporosarcina]GKV66995.1 UPF0754 membrane protein [Sporosarcina sp. NCCP-2331]GLB57325.1 UPF0754 membrane protein [Sporosarcina sp. NCCP-2378]
MKRLTIVLTILFMAFIGALIGGVTNHLAIKMLFRPHEPKFIGKTRLPFTPGLIPKRRSELAVQLGKTVTNYLLTPDLFRRKLMTPVMEERVEKFVQDKMNKYILQSDKTLNDWLEITGAADLPEQVEDNMLTLIDRQLTEMKLKVTTGTVEEVVPLRWQQQVEERIPLASDFLLQRAEQYIDSTEGRETFQKLIDDFLNSKGTFGGMLNMFFGDSDSLVGKIQREALRFAGAPGTKELLDKLIWKEWRNIQQQPMEKLTAEFDFDSVFHSVRKYALDQLALRDRLDHSLEHYWPKGAEWTADNITPQIVKFVFKQAELQLEQSLQKLKLDEMVKEQVDTFPVAVLEDLVLGISRREFKMITVLGAVLGGAIGIIQGIIAITLNGI